MKGSKHLISSLVLLIALSNLVQAQEGRKIVPLKSTRSDVERIFGKPDGWSHKLENESVRVEYSSGSCNGESDEWNVPADTVTSLTVYYKTKKSLADFQLDETKYKREKDVCLIDNFSYINEEEGISFYVDTNLEKVLHVIYSPSSKYNPLRCKSLKNDR